MKKKIALFLAAIMTFAVIAPMNLMASSSATTTRRISGHDEDTLVPQDTLRANGWNVYITDFADQAATGLGGDLKITLNTGGTPDDILDFSVDLDNAEWAFIQANHAILDNGEPEMIDDVDPLDPQIPNPDYEAYEETFDVNQFTKVVSKDGNFVTGLYYPGSSGIPWTTNWKTTAAAINATKNYTAGQKVAYYIEIDSGYKSSARIQYATGASMADDAVIMIPLVIKTDSDGPVTAMISMGQDLNDQDVAVTNVATGTRTKVDKVEEGTTEVQLKPIFIDEYNANTIKNGQFKITAPKGYQFKTDKYDMPIQLDGSDVTATGTGIGNGIVDVLETTKNGTVFNAEISGKTAEQIKARIKITGLVLEPIDDVLKYNVNLALTIEDIKDKTKITKQTFDVAKFVKAAILYSAKESEDIKSGYRDQETAKITMEEQTEDSWWARRDTTFTLTDANGDVLDGVKFTSGEVKTSNLTEGIDDVLLNDEDHKGVRGENSKRDGFYFNDDGNVLTIMSMSAVSGKKGKIEATFNLSADINYEGDVYVTVGSTDIKYVGDNYIEHGGTVKVATVKPTIAIETKSTSTQVGAQRISVADIIISEVNADNMLERNKFIDLMVGQYGNGTESGIDIVPLKDANITVSGDMKIKVESSKGANVKLKIDRVSMDDLSTFTVENVNVNINRSVPYGEYELYVSGDAIRDNEDGYEGQEASGMRDAFDNEGIVVDKYITVDTAPSNPAYSTKVVIYNKNTANAIVNGVATEMGAPTVNINDRLYVPLRFIVLALGGQDTDIVWSNTSRTASITINQRTVTWTEGSNFYVGSNGARVGMDSDATATIVNDRLYIPFGAFAQAFNIPVVWDEVAQTATYNPAVNK